MKDLATTRHVALDDAARAYKAAKLALRQAHHTIGQRLRSERVRRGALHPGTSPSPWEYPVPPSSLWSMATPSGKATCWTNIWLLWTPPFSLRLPPRPPPGEGDSRPLLK